MSQPAAEYFQTSCMMPYKQLTLIKSKIARSVCHQPLRS